VVEYVWEKIQVVNGEPSERILIIARNLRYVHEWCRIHAVNPNSRMVKVVTRADDFLGLGTTGSYYVDLGTDDDGVKHVLERLKSLDAVRPLLTPNT
jgi:hypothetical protein